MITVHHLNNSRSQRVLWLLEELGLPYEAIAVDTRKGEQFAADFLKVNPNAKVPA